MLLKRLFMNNIEDKSHFKQGSLFLLRHADRPPIPEGSFGNELAITHQGREKSTSLGQRIGSNLYSIHSSPVLRCMETTQYIISGSNKTVPITEDKMLGNPGAFISNASVAEKNWERFGHEKVCKKLLFHDQPMEGFYPPKKAAMRLLTHMMLHRPPKGFTTLFITHDIIIAAIAVRLFNLTDYKKIWPDFLDGLKVETCKHKISIQFYKYMSNPMIE